MKQMFLVLLSFFSAAIFTGCAGSKPVAVATAEPAAAARTAAAHSADTNKPIAKSVFAVDSSAQDPFFPKARKTVPSSPATAQAEALAAASLAEVPAELSAALQGIGGTSDRRVAVISNVILEIGRSAVIPISTGSRSRSLAVRCRDITRDSVVLDVEGYGQVVVTRKQVL